MSDGVCGYEDTTTGHPCRHPAGSCPVPSHTDHTIPDGGNPQGRDPKLTLERQEEIAQAIENGKSVGSAARRAGLHPSTVYRWIDKGQDQDEGIYRDFRERYIRARGEGLDFYESNIIDIALAEQDIPTLMTLMRQQYPDDYGDAKRGDQTGFDTIIDLPQSVIKQWQRRPNG